MNTNPVGSEFDLAWAITRQYEGGYANDSRDPGGETNFGISKRSYPQEDILHLTPARAEYLYKRDYWFPMRLDALNSQKIANNLFDFAVHHGVRGVVKKIQFLLVDQWSFKGPIDGIMGNQTISYMNEVMISTPDALLTLHTELVAVRAMYYLAHAEDWEVRGFLKRAVSFL